MNFEADGQNLSEGNQPESVPPGKVSMMEGSNIGVAPTHFSDRAIDYAIDWPSQVTLLAFVCRVFPGIQLPMRKILIF